MKFQRASKRIVLAALILAPSVIGALVWSFGESERQRHLGWSCVGVVVLLLLFLWVTEMVGSRNQNPVRGDYGYLEIVIGADGYGSTSKAVSWIWSLIFASALMLLGCMTWFSDLTPEKAFGSNWNDYLLLLGGPYASAVLAKGITVAKAEKPGSTSPSSPAAAGAVGTTPSTPVLAEAAQTSPAATSVQIASTTTASITSGIDNPAAERPQVSDLFKGKGGGTSLPDTQYLLFSWVAIAYFIGAFIQNLVEYAGGTGETAIELPPIPAALLGLTSLAAATYVGAKVVETDSIRVVSIQPQPGAGTIIGLLITVVNAGTVLSESTIGVTFTNVADRSAQTPGPRAGSLTTKGTMTSFWVDVDLQNGTYEVIVTTPHGSTPPTRLTREPPSSHASTSASPTP
jgi:hypothetical protein